MGPNRQVGSNQPMTPVSWMLTAIAMGWFGLMIMAPGLALAQAAFKDGVEPFWKAVTSPEAIEAFRLTAFAAFAATVINTVLGLVLALTLARQRFWGHALLDGLVDMPFAISPVIAGLMLIVVYGPTGWLGPILEPMGIQIAFHWPALVLATAFVTLPFVVREVVPVLREFGIDQEEVAETLGAGWWRTFWRVTLPSIRWGLAYGVALTIARGLGEFGALLVVSGNISGRTQTSTLYIHDAVENFDNQAAYAASLVLAAISFALLLMIEYARGKVVEREERT